MKRALIDIHGHYLFGVDDGAQTPEETEKMLRIALEQDIYVIVVTPHYNRARGMMTSLDIIQERFEATKEMARDINPNMQILLGMEIAYDSQVRGKLKRGELLSLAGSSSILLEFRKHQKIDEIVDGIRDMKQTGYHIVLAHPERYDDLVAHPNMAETICNMDVKLQLDANSLMGEAGWNAKRFAQKLLKNDMVYCIATDSHGSIVRTPNIEKCRRWIEKKCGEEAFIRYMQKNPLDILNETKERN